MVQIHSHLSPRLSAILQAFFVTFLWSTSWVFIKIGLHGTGVVIVQLKNRTSSKIG